MRLFALLSMIAIGLVQFGAAAAFEAPVVDKPATKVVPQLGHTRGISSVAFSPDGRLALSGSSDKTLKLWEVASGRLLRNFTGHAGGVNSVAFSPDGALALSGSDDHTLKLWELATGRVLKTFTGHVEKVNSVAFSPDGKLALSGGGDIFKTLQHQKQQGELMLWDLATGRLLKSFTGHTDTVSSVAFSPDGTLALSGSADRTLKLWELATGRALKTFTGHADKVGSVVFSPDGKTALSGGGDIYTLNDQQGELKLWDMATGRELRRFIGHANAVSSVAFSPDGTLALSGGHQNRPGAFDNTLRLWEVATGRLLKTFTGHAFGVTSVAFSPDGSLALSGSTDQTLKTWDLATGRERQTFGGRTSAVMSVAFSPDGTRALSASFENSLKLWDLATGRRLKSFTGTNGARSVAISPDGKLALSASDDYTLKLWDLATGRKLKSFSGHTGWVLSVAFSPDGTRALSGSFDNTLKLWDVASGRELMSFTGRADAGAIGSVAFSPDGTLALSADLNNMQLWDLATGRERKRFTGTYGGRSVAFSPDGKFALSASDDNTLKLWELAGGRQPKSFKGHTSYLNSVAFSPDGTRALSGSDDGTLKLWEVPTGRLLRTFTGHEGAVMSVAFSSDGRLALSAGWDGSVRIWDAKIREDGRAIGKGPERGAMLASASGERLTITPEGFFSSSHRDTDMLTIVRGLEATTIGQVYQSLFNPDLVREALAGDPNGEVKRAAEVINLDKVVDSGPAPEVEIASQSSGRKSDSDLVTIVARIKDRGKGIGRIEWRVNGVTIGVTNAPAGAGSVHEVRQEVALELGDNEIEVVAYNARNLLASAPARTTIAYVNLQDSVKPKLHILAIGINAYEDRGWAPPGAEHIEYFPPLGLAVADAKAFAAELQKAGAGLYSEVRVTTALDAQATAAGLDAIVKKIAAGIDPRDTFVLFAAAHGYSQGGRFYLIPQDYQGGPNPEALAAKAIGQERLQDWIANRIRAKKAIVLLDTCESGALTNGCAHSRVDAPASEAAVGRLHEATGRPVLTAAAAGQSALELTKLGHGVFTSALIAALHNGDSNGDGLIEVSELAAYVEDLVPKLVAGGEARAAIAKRGSADERQSAHFGTTGSDFALVKRLP